jgi:dTDP-glucose pyrophosphorylase
MLAQSKDFRKYVLQSGSSLRETMIRIGSADTPFVLVVGMDGRLKGTVTDGDLRRAVLRNLSLETPIDAAMNPNPRVGKWGRDSENEKLLMTVPSKLAFLPLVDDDRVLRDVLISRQTMNPVVSALVMAGGFGKRLGERTRNTPKPLLEVKGRPILDHILEQLENARINRIFVSAHFLADKIRAFIEARPSRVPVTVIEENEPLGTAGAVGLLPEDLLTPFILLNGDIITNLDFDHMIDFHFRHTYDATLAVAQHAVQIPFGVVRHSPDGLFLSVEEKPTLLNFVAAGLYLLSPEFRNLVRPGERIDTPDLLNRGRASGLKCGLFPIHEYWTDVGRPEDFDLADTRQDAGPLG